VLVIGKPVGLGDGNVVGIGLGPGLGTMVGIGLGIDVGYIVGEGDGLRVGTEVGLRLLPEVGVIVGYKDSQQSMLSDSDPVTRNLLPLYSFHDNTVPISGSFPSQVCSIMYR